MFAYPAIVAVLALGLLGSGCRAIHTPYPFEHLPEWPHDRPETSREYCFRLANSTDKYAQQLLVAGIVMGALATGAAIAGAAMGPVTTEGAHWTARNRNALFVAAGGLLAVPTTVLLMRSKSASNASAAAGSSLNPALAENERMKQCLAARAELAGSRGAAAELVQQHVDDALRTLQDSADRAKEDLAESEAALRSSRTPAERAKHETARDNAEQRLRALNSQILQLLPPPAEGPSPRPAKPVPSP